MCGTAALHSQNMRVDVGLHHPVELLGGDVGDAAVLRHLVRGVVDQHVDAAELLAPPARRRCAALLLLAEVRRAP